MCRILGDARRSAGLAAAAAALPVFVSEAGGAGASDPSFARGVPVQGARRLTFPSRGVALGGGRVKAALLTATEGGRHVFLGFFAAAVKPEWWR
jgi:hypothetical protein